MNLPDLYHWSPADRRDNILAQGLRPYSPPSVNSMAFPCICLASSPLDAWRLSGDMGWTSEVEEWDLWQVRLADGDEVHVLPEFGPKVKEIRVNNAIPPYRVIWVARREPLTGRCQHGAYTSTDCPDDCFET